MRLVAALAAAAALTACASTPSAPISRPSAPAAPSVEAPRIVWPERPLQCVPFARGASGVDIYGDAHTWWGQAEGRYARSQRPANGAVIVLRGYNDPSRGHVAVVRAVRSDREIVVDHANWHNRGEIAFSAPVMDVSPRGDWSVVRVFNVLEGAWGGRVYEVEGFILPDPLGPSS